MNNGIENMLNLSPRKNENDTYLATEQKAIFEIKKKNNAFYKSLLDKGILRIGCKELGVFSYPILYTEHVSRGPHNHGTIISKWRERTLLYPAAIYLKSRIAHNIMLCIIYPQVFLLAPMQKNRYVLCALMLESWLHTKYYTLFPPTLSVHG
uniref:Uncharacterized protein n=1 Tax=Cacopsylla melanoneura TaxID=428564 RepID=A0A8D8PUL8_9HEMI